MYTVIHQIITLDFRCDHKLQKREMSRRGGVFVGLTVVLLIAFSATAVLGALNESQKKDLAGLYQQMFEIQKQIINKQVEYQQLTPDQGKWMIDQME